MEGNTDLPVGSLRHYSSENTLALRDFVSIDQDLQDAISFLKQIDAVSEEEAHVTKVALWNAALISFFKCFGSGARTSRLDRSIFEHLKGQALEFFDYLRNLRNKHIAHSVSELEQFYYALAYDDQQEQIVGGWVHVRKIFDNDKHVEQFLILCHQAREHLKPTIEKMTRDQKEETSLLSKDTLANLPVLEHVFANSQISASVVRRTKKQDVHG
ncbi:MAG: hypothetical protein ACE37D_09100 [Pseudomonadales bacterium]